MAISEEKKVHFPDGASDVTFNNLDYVMGVKPDGKFGKISKDALKDGLTIEGQRIQAVAPGALPAGPTGQTRYMEVTAVGTWTYGGIEVGSNADGYRTTFWWNGTAWSKNGDSVKIQGNAGANGASGSNGKTSEPFDPAKTGGYAVGSQVFFDGAIWQASSAAAMGESPATNPAKWGNEPVFEGGDKEVSLKVNGNHLDDAESIFSLIGRIGSLTDPTYRRTPKIRVFEGGVITAHTARDSGNQTIIVYNLAGAEITRVSGTVTNALTTFTYIAPQDCDIVVQTRIATAPEGYWLKIDSDFFIEKKVINKRDGIVSYEIFSNLFKTKKLSENIFTFKGALSISNGKFTPNEASQYRTSPMFEIKAGVKITFYGYFHSTINAISFFSTPNENNYVSGVAVNANNLIAKAEFTAPTDGFVRMSTYLPTLMLHPITVELSDGSKPILNTRDFTEFKDTEGGLLSYDLGKVLINSKTLFYANRPTTNPDAIISFIDDDGHADVYTYLYPYLKSRGIPFGSAIVGSYVEAGTFGFGPVMSKADLKTMANDFQYVEIYNHTYDHLNLNTINPQQQYEQLYKNHHWISQQGIKPMGFCAPNGSINLSGQKVVSEFYTSNYGVGALVNTRVNMLNMNINRAGFGNSRKLAAMKILVDQTVANKGWLVVMTHVSGFDNFAEWQIEFEQLVDYIVASGASIMKSSEAFEIRKNQIEIVGDRKLCSDGLIRPY